MSQVDNPDYRQIRAEFLTSVRSFHERHDYSLDWILLAESLGVRVGTGPSNQHTSIKGLSVISYDLGAPLNRQLFTGLHEVCHELFSGSDECFRALTEDKYGLDVARTLEETLCDEAASILLVPDHVLEEALKENGYSPQAIFHLSARAGSLAACLMRVLLSQNAEAWGLILQRDGTIEFSCTNTRFPFRKSYRVEAEHKIHEAWHGAVESRTPLPFASGSRAVRKPMRAASNGRRVVALFAAAFPPKFDPAQIPLFA